MYLQVAVNRPINGSILTYKTDGREISVGEILEVPLGKGKIKGLVLGFTNEIDSKFADKIKKVLGPLSEDIKLGPEEIELFTWMSQYYHYDLGPLIFEALPKILKNPRKLKFDQSNDTALEIALNEKQQVIFEEIESKINSGFMKFLVHGVTGSGKSLIYISLIKEVLAKGKSALFLLPEINLTSQFIEFFKNYLNCPVYSYNSSISNSGKYGLWKILQEDDSPKVIVGVRSSIFLPIKNLGIIVVDEEHDQSFKQEERCPYNGRDVAIKKAGLLNIPIILGSATPTLETYYQFKHKTDPRNFYFELKDRFGTGALPEIILSDAREKGENSEEIWPFKEDTIKKISQALEKGEQVLIFLNRLGHSAFVQCSACSYKFSCPNCSCGLRYYKKKSILKCQICEYQAPLPEICPECSNLKIINMGFGTEKLHEVIEKLYPEKKISRFDRDDLTTNVKMEKRLKEFHEGEVDILIGTQMLSKGHNFKKVNLVVVMGIDGQLNFPDFRSQERTYQQLTQVSGRSGRYEDKGEVVVQTLNGDNPLFKIIKEHSFNEFYDSELSIREVANCPPFTKLIAIYLTSKSLNTLRLESDKIGRVFNDLIGSHFKDVELLGPRPCLIEKRVNKFSWAFLIRSKDLGQLHNLLKSMLKNVKIGYDLQLKIEVDPYHIH